MNITEQDFDHLTVNSMQWGPYWKKQEGRFEGIAPFKKLSFSPEIMGYWTQNYSDAMLCREFLASKKMDCSLHWDTATEDYLILTPYKTQSWVEHFASVND